MFSPCVQLSIISWWLRDKSVMFTSGKAPTVSTVHLKLLLFSTSKRRETEQLISESSIHQLYSLDIDTSFKV